MNEQIKYGRGRFPIIPQKGLCRGCHNPVPRGRHTWCSIQCYNTFEPSRVKYAAKTRDKGICAACGVQTKDSWPRTIGAPKANYDHIIPFSEGGLTILENIRTLCEPCHKVRTKNWHKERKNTPPERQMR